jgi:hypothetical protein
MKKNSLLMVTALVLCLCWFGCNKSGKLSKSSEFKPPAGPVEFKLKWPLGERVEQDMDMKTKSEISYAGQPTPIKQDTTMGQAYGLTVLQANPDGTHEIEMDLLSARMSLKSGGRSMLDYDSAKRGEGGKPNPVAAIFDKIVGSKIRYYLDASNAVERVEGVDDLMNRLATGAKPQEVAPLKSMFNEGYFKQLMSANLFLPPKPVQPGDSWPVQMEIPLGMMGTMVMNYDFTFKNWEMHGKRNCARLEFAGTIETKPNAAAGMAGFSMTMQNGSTSGVSWFDPELGITIDTAMNMDYSMIMRVPTGNAKAKGGPKMQTMTNTMDQAITIKLVSVK